jgi:hypothetical protein
MQWHLEDIPFILTRLPHALHDLIHHEDKELVAKAERTLSLAPLTAGPRHAISITPSDAGSAISVEKSLDPLALRSAENIGLLMHDYVQQLPGLELPTAEGRKLLAHWREIMVRQPERFASAHLSQQDDERCRHMLEDALKHWHGPREVPEEDLSAAWEDWQRASAVGHESSWHGLQQQKMQTHQWQDLVMRTRLYYLHQKITRGSMPGGTEYF